MWAKRKQQAGFTIVELLIVIVVIGILAAISIVAYNGIQNRAKVASLTSDLRGAATQIKLEHASNSAYPVSIAAANAGAGLKSSAGNTYRYSVSNSTNPQTFCLSATEGTMFYSVTESSIPSAGSCVNVAAGATASHTYITNGNTATSEWHGVGGLGSVTVSMSSAQDVSSIKVWHYYGDGRTYYGTKTEVSEDNVNWVTIFDSATDGTYQETSAGKMHTFSQRKVRYIRDWANGSTSNSGSHWVEIQAF